MMEAMGEANRVRGWALYDGSCGFCNRWIGVFRGTLARRGIEVAPLQSSWVAEKFSIPPEQLLDDFRLMLSDGRQFAGANAYRHLMAQIWWLFPAYLASRVPGLRRAFDWAYRSFADNRHRLSRSCGIQR
jgi:predicted DCC family thiol-disulfide oxidoreductase YuxK